MTKYKRNFKSSSGSVKAKYNSGNVIWPENVGSIKFEITDISVIKFNEIVEYLEKQLVKK